MLVGVGVVSMLDELKAIEDIDDFECLVGGYQVGHSTLILIVRNGLSKTRRNFYIFFENVKYFSGPLKWQGADFKQGTTEECLKRLTQAKVYPDKTFLRDDTQQRLYQVDLGSMVVEIIASHARIQQDTD
jgi:hypothetical protein